MNHFLDDDTRTGGQAVRTGPDDEPALEQRAAAGDQEAFDLLYDRYFARMAWYFTIFSQREAKAAVEEVMLELFGTLAAPSDHSLARRAYDLARATEHRHVAALEEARAAKPSPAKVGAAKARATSTLPLRA